MGNSGNRKREQSADNIQQDQEEIVLRLTARYVEEIQAGHQPDISEYLSRYPQYADAIASFIAYYHTVEFPLPQSQTNTALPDYISDPEETDPIDEFVKVFHIAEESAWQRVMSPGQTTGTEKHVHLVYDHEGGETDYSSGTQVSGAIDSESYGQIVQSLLTMARCRKLSSSQLAAHLYISEDILGLVEQQAIVPESIPLELYRRLADVLQQPVHRMQRSFAVEQRRVAEHTGSYETETTSDELEQISFREAVENSNMVSPELAQFWRDVFSQEGL